LTINGPTFDKVIIDEMADWSRESYPVPASYYQVDYPEDSLKALAMKYSHLLETSEWAKIPPPPVTSRPLSEMTREERNLLHAVYFGYFDGAAQQWKERNEKQEH
jgi:hypothetical protein